MNIFLVDDEMGIVEGLKTIIRRHIPECNVVGTAYNGVEGARLIKDAKPDIVITDIRMPQADGLEMIQRLKAAGCPAKFIILSGYAEFEYARKGIHLGVQFYINKPVEEEELQDCVRRVMAEIDAERAKLREVDRLREQVHSKLAESVLRDVIDAGGEDPAHLKPLLGTIGFPLMEEGYICALLEFDTGADALQEERIEALYREIEMSLHPYRHIYCFRYAASQLAVIVGGGGLEERAFARAVKGIKENLLNRLKLPVLAGTGLVYDTVGGISKSFEEARQALSYRALTGKHEVIAYSDIAGHQEEHRVIVSAELIAVLETCIDNNDPGGSLAAIDTIFASLAAEKSLSLAALQSQCLTILLSSLRKLPFHQLQHHDFLNNHILPLDGIARFKTMDQLRDWLSEAARRIIAFKSDHRMSRKKDVIAEVKEYVAEHYRENISLAELSGRFFINPYYLSQLFKQKTGGTYLNYLAKTRIDKACELLEQTELKVYEICQLVGYTDANYFARLFEKQVGLKPTEFRRRQSGL
ncbi:MAG: AraC family transcriptional regulator [Paenibacillaceae bacterium]|jgi:two-component system response regulator YesN|nr:AraC family transcriptional regulator [Paenibacillaceae bacterium]